MLYKCPDCGNEFAGYDDSAGEPCICGGVYYPTQLNEDEKVLCAEVDRLFGVENGEEKT